MIRPFRTLAAALLFCLPIVALASPPTITVPPQSWTVVESGDHTFTVVASGDVPLTYQWRRDGSELINRTNSTLPLVAIQTNDAGLYSVVITNAEGSVTSSPVRLTVRLASDPAYPTPQGGWTYIYQGDAMANDLFAALDGTWNHQNDSWSGDGRGVGNDLAGGVSVTNGVVTFEDAVAGGTGFNNRRYNFTRDLTQDPGVTNASSILNDGVTLTFRARLTPASDPLIEITNAPNGVVNNSDGKGMFGIRQSGSSGLLLGFSLNQAVEDTTTSSTFNFGQAGLHMNNLNGNTRTANVDPGEGGSLNLLELNPAQFHEFWVTIQDNGEDPGTHRVSIYLDGSITPTVFNVTAGSGLDGPAASYLVLGLGNSTAQRGAVDVDFFGYRPGAVLPSAFNQLVSFGTQPTNQLVLAGETATFTATVSGTPPYTFQWYRDGQAIQNATNSIYTTEPAQLGDSGAQFTIVVTSEINSITSAPPALLQILVPPSITGQPQSLTVTNGDPASFSVAASSLAAPAYQWRHNGTNLPGASGAMLSIGSASAANAGGYDVIVANASGANTSVVATLTVVLFDFGDAPDAGYLTLKASNGARHVIAPGVFLGAGIDTEVDGQSGTGATGDDVSGIDDEDGVHFVSSLRLGMTSSVQVVASTNGFLNAWLDLDRNGSWNGAGEQVFTNVALIPGTNSLEIAVPASATAGASYARFRFATVGDLSFDGPASDGEVEDYAVTVFAVADLSVTQSDSPDPVAVNSNLTYSIVVSNAGPFAAMGVVFSNALPSGVDFVSAIPSQGSCSHNAGQVACLLGSMVNGASASISLLVRPNQSGDITNTVTVSSADVDLNPGNNSAASTTAALDAPSISVQPQNQIVASGSTVILGVTSSGAAPLHFQWRFNGDDLPDQTNATLTITDLLLTDSGNYSVRITNLVGSIESQSAALLVLNAPSIIGQPESITNLAGTTAMLSITAAGSQPLTYQWYFNATNLVGGATEAALSLSNVQSSNAGSYRVVVTNAVGVVTSTPATLTVIEMDFGDAPDGYPTAWSTNGARHRVVSGVRLGALIDFEPDAAVNPAGTGDDLNGVDDEDGVTFSTPLRTGLATAIAVVASTNGFLNGWVDFDRSGSWAEAGEQVFTNRALVTGTNNLTFLVPGSASAGASFARFRFATASDLSLVGEAADGEVEDYPVTIEAIADLGITSVQQISPVANGANQTYTILVSNAGPATATGVALTDTLPPGVSFLSATPSQGSCSHSAGFVVCPLGILPAGGTATVGIIVVPNAVGLITNSVTVGGNLTDLNGANNSASVVALVMFAPQITTQPQNQTVTNGGTATFNVAASGSGLRYQWLQDSSEDLNATNATLSITNAQPANAGLYTVRVTNDVGSVVSTPALLTVLVPASITTQPQSQTVLSGTTVTLSVVATGSTPLMYQWQLEGTDLTGETGSSLVLTNVQLNQAGAYRVRVSNVVRTVTSDPATLTVHVLPVFTQQPESRTNYVGSSATFTALVTGTQPLRYQWYFNATNLLTTATNTSLTLTNLQMSQAGDYSLVATNIAGSATSAVAVLTVYAVDFGDAPEALGYPTTFAFNGARHRLVPGVRLGALADFETDGLPGVAATGDDTAGSDDEDGVILPPALLLGQVMNIPVVASTNGFLDAWIDFNADGAWTDSGEQVLSSRALVAGTNIVGVPISSAALLTNTFARFRFSTAGGLSYDGFAADGEVEDYAVSIVAAIDLGVTLVDSIDPVPVAGNLNYTMVVTNRGPSVATDVLLTNTLPASLTVVSITTSQGSCTNIGGMINCSIGSLGTEGSATISVATLANVPGTFLTRATVIGSEAEANPSDNTVVEGTAVVFPAVDFTNLVSIAVSDGTATGPGTGNPYPSTILVSGLTGTVYKVTATLNNVSHSFAGDLDVLLVGPGGQSVMLMSDAAGGFVLSGVTITFDDDAGISLPSGGVISPTSYRPTNYDPASDLFPPPAPEEPFGSAMSVFTGTDPNGTWSLYVIDDEINDTGTIGAGWRLNITTADPIADIAVTANDSVDPVAVNSNLVYSITVTNRGPASATGVSVTNRLPAGVTFVSAIPSQGNCAQQSGVVSCQIGNLDPATNATITVTVVPLTLGLYTNEVAASGAQVDFVSNNNLAIVQTAARLPVDVLAAQAASTNLVLLGQQLTYTLSVTNRGPNVATNVRLLDPLPPDVSFVSVSSAQAACTNEGGTIRCELASLASGARAQVTLVVQPTSLGSITNTATVATDEADVVPANNSSALVTTVNVVADLGMAMIHSPDPIAVSNQLTYSIAVTNHGPSTANDAELQAPLPPDVVFISAVSPQGSCTNDTGTVRCSLGALAVGGTNAVVLVVQPIAIGRLTNAVSLSTSSIDLVSSNNAATNIATVELPPFIVASPESVIVTNGANVTFSVNAGGSSPLTYQWQFNETNLVGETADNLVLTNVPYSARGSYRVRVANNVGAVFSAAATLTVLVPPSISDITDRIIDEDAATQVIAFTVGDADSLPDSLIPTASSSNPALVSTSQIVFGGAGGNRTIEITPIPNASGATTITIEVRDGDNLTAADSFVLTVQSINDPPTLAGITNQFVLEDTTLLVNLTVGDIDSALSELQLAAVSSNPALVAATNITFSGSGADRLMQIFPATNHSGSATLTVSVTDTNGAIATAEFTLNVVAVNDPPTIAPITNQTTMEDISLEVAFTVDDVDSPLEELAFVVTSSNPSLAEATNVVITGTGSSRLMTIHPSTNQSGSATITISVSDTNGAMGTAEFVLTVLAANDAPTLEAIAPQTTPEDIALVVNLAVGDIDSALSELQLGATSSNPALVAATNITFSGAGADRLMQIFPATNQSGSVTLTVSVTDTNGAIATAEFILNVVAVNDPPTIAPITNQSTMEDISLAVAFTVDDVDSPLEELAFVVTSSNPSLVEGTNIVITGTGSSRLMTIHPATNQNGSATITISASDTNAAMGTAEFVLTVLAANDAPTLEAIAPQTTPEDVVLLVNLSVGDIDSALSELQIGATSSNPALVAATNITFSGSGSSRLMTIHPATNESGSATITVTLNDTNGATATAAFELAVVAVNDTPTLDPIANLTLNQGAGLQIVQLTNITSGASNELQSLVVTATSSDLAIIPHPVVTYTSANSAGSLTFTPLVDTNATVTLTVTVDDGGDANRTFDRAFTVTLRVLAAPVITEISHAGGTANITFTTATGLNCTVEHKDSPDAPAWTPLPSIIATDSVMTVTDPAAVVPTRIYRVLVQ